MNHKTFVDKLFLWVCAVPIIFMSVNATAYEYEYEKEITRLSATMAEKISAANKTKVAVVDFTDISGNVTHLGRFIAEEFSVALVSAGKGFQVVDRIHLHSIIKEHKLSKTGLIDPKTARELGKIAGVEALITGTLTPFGDSIRIVVKILDTSTAVIIDANGGKISKIDAIKKLEAISVGENQQKQTNDSDSSSTTLANPFKPTKPSPKTIAKVDANGFTFELEYCQLSDSKVTCRLFITNNIKDKELRIYIKSRIFDDSGYEYHAKKVWLGNKSSTGSYVLHFMVKDIRVSSYLQFETATSSPISMLSLLQIYYYYSGGNQKFVQFRNIVLSKK
ncbi:conserved hypothetical protein, secreted [Beggiatoa sp. PS]|nr:conserved hypothetical protein, secreted [Beggiatoa sp. PS]